jgi:DNA-binding response OmpR family regulator
MPKVLVVEDDRTVAEIVSGYLERDGFEARVAGDGPGGLEQWTRWRPDLVVLDVMLPGLSGLDVLRRRRREGDDTLVVILSASGEEEDRVVGLEVGADDYLIKPFSPRELVLRVQGLLRRSERPGDPAQVGRIRRGDLLIDVPGREVWLGEARLSLTNREFDLLGYLAAYPGRAFTKEELLRRVWGWDFGDTSTVTVHIRRLREKVEADPSDPRIVLTARGRGYRFAGPADGEAGEP